MHGTHSPFSTPSEGGRAEPAAAAQSCAPAGQPFTFNGVARFAAASTARLLAVQSLVAALGAFSIVYFLTAAWWPPVTEAVAKFPDAARFYGGRLEWPLDGATELANTPHLSLQVEEMGRPAPPTSADLILVFETGRVRLHWLAGGSFAYYPRDLELTLDRPVAMAWWGAWRPMLAAGAGLAAFVVWCFVWWILSVLYALVALTAAFFGDRRLGVAGAWRISNAALMPGALLLALSIAAYGGGSLRLDGLLRCAALHILVGWVYLAGALPKLPVRLSGLGAPPGLDSSPRPANPFSPNRS